MSATLDVAARGTVGDTSASTGEKLKSFGKSSIIWLVVIVVVLIATTVGFVSQLGSGEQRNLHYNNVTQTGTAAIAGIMRDHGINVTTTESYDTAVQAAANPSTTVVVLTDQDLVGDEFDGLGSAMRQNGSHLVLVEPLAVGLFTNRITSDGTPGNIPINVTPQCTYPPAQRAGQVRAGQTPFNRVNPQDGSVCYPYGSNTFGLVTVPDDSGTVTVLGNAQWLQNANLREDGNAALVLGTIADNPNVVLYYPVSTQEPTPSPFSLIPPWFLLSVAWLIPVFVVAVLWAGRRFGPLTVETLPVTVPPIETVTGHAGLLQRTGNRAEVVRILRAASLVRMGRTLAVPANAEPATVCQAIATRTNLDYSAVEEALITGVASTDAQLTDLASRIDHIESEVRSL